MSQSEQPKQTCPKADKLDLHKCLRCDNYFGFWDGKVLCGLVKPEPEREVTD